MANTILATVESALDVLAAEAAKDFRKTMQTWTSHKSDVAIEKSHGRRTVSVTNQIYSYINYGTDVRRALLTPDWISKTQPGIIGSGAGQGLVVTASRSFAFPGIKARNFDEAIVARIEEDVLPAILEGLANDFQRIAINALGK